MEVNTPLPTDVLSAEDGPLSRLRQDQVGVIEVSREALSPQTPKEQRTAAGMGYAGTVSNSEGYLEVIRQKWGGGTYRLRGIDSDGRPVNGIRELPGTSKPLVLEDQPDEDDDDDDDYPGVYPGSYPRPYPGVYPPGYPNQAGYPQVPPGYPPPWMQTQGYPQQRPPWMEGTTSKEAEQLRAERDEARSELRRLQETLERERRETSEKIGDLREQLRGAQESAKLEQVKADFQRQLAELQAGAKQPQGDPNAKLLGTIVTAMLSRKEVDPLEVAKLVKSLSSGQGDSLKQFRELLMLKRDLDEFGGDRDDTAVGQVTRVVRDLIPLLPQQQADENGQNGQVKVAQVETTQAAQAQEEAMWKELLQEVRTYHASGNTPDVAAAALAGWARAKGMTQHLPRLAGYPSATKLLDALLALSNMSGPDFGQALREFVGTFKDDETANEWLDGLLKTLRGDK